MPKAAKERRRRTDNSGANVGSTSKECRAEEGVRSEQAVKKRRRRHRRPKAAAAVDASTDVALSGHKSHSNTPKVHPSSFYAYDAELGTWAPYRPTMSSSSTAPPPILRLMTYNTFSSSPSRTDDPTVASACSRAVLQVLETSRANVISLQEVSAAFAEWLCEQTWTRAGWLVVGMGGRGAWQEWAQVTERGAWSKKKKGDSGGKDAVPETCAMLVRRDIVGLASTVGLAALERARASHGGGGGGGGEQGKGVWILSLCASDGSKVEYARIATSHFSSLPVNAKVRQRQYRAVLALLDGYNRNVTTSPLRVLLADFNASRPADFNLLLKAGYCDALPLAIAAAAAAVPATSCRQTGTCSTTRVETETETEESFRSLQHATFGALYPYLPAPAPRHKPRKPRRIDRAYVSLPPPMPPTSDSGSGSGSGSGMRVVGYEQLGDTIPVRNRGEEGQVLKCREGRDGFEWPSDHSAVVVEIRCENVHTRR